MLFGLENKECSLWFRVRPGSVVLDFLLPQRLIMFAIVQCVNRMEFLQLMGVIAVRVGTILVLKKAEDTNFSFQNSFIQACKLENIESIEFFRLAKVDVNKPLENMFIEQKKEEIPLNSLSDLLLLDLQMQFEDVANAFVIAIIENDMIELGSLLSCVHEQIPSIASFFSSIKNKADFFIIARYFLNFLNVSFLVAIEKISSEICSDVNFEISSYEERIVAIKRGASISSLKTTVLGQITSKPQLPGIILVHIVLSNEWLPCSISIVEKLALNIFSFLGHPEELHWFKIAYGSPNIIVQFHFPESLMVQLIDSGKKKKEFMKALGVSILKVGNEYVLKHNCNHFTFENSFLECKQNNNDAVLQFLSEIQQDLLPTEQEYCDENNNLMWEGDADSTALMISCARGNSKIVQLLLDNGADPNIQTKIGANSLIYALYSADCKVVQLLLECNPHLADVSDKISALHVLCSFGNIKILKLLLNQKPRLNVKNSEGSTPLLIACSRLHESSVRLLLKTQADPNIPNNNGTTPLSIAAQTNCLPIVQCLLKARADPNIQDRFGTTALFFAVKNNALKMFHCLLDVNADPCIETSFHSSAFHLAAEAGNISMVKRILKQKSPNFSLSNGKTPLYSACDGDQIEILELLIKAGANPNTLIDTENGTITPLSRACYIGNLTMICMLIKANADSNFQGKDTFLPLFAAIIINDPEIVDILLEANADPNARSRDRFTPLMYACKEGHLEIVNSLLKAKANPNVQDVNGATPLAITIKYDKEPSMILAPLKRHVNQFRIVDALLKTGADPNIPDNENSTPLHIAASKGITNIASALLKEKANPNCQDIHGVTPLHKATVNGHLEVIKVLFIEKADPNIIVFDDAIAPLHISCGPRGSLEITQAILSCPNTNPNILDGKKNTPLHFAAFNANPKILQCLIASNANPNAQNRNGITPLHALCVQDASKSLVEMVNVLLEANADPNVQLLHELSSPLYDACVKGNLEVVKSLLKAKANSNIQDKNGNTPLVVTVGNTPSVVSKTPNQYEIVDALLQAGADPNIGNIENYTPLLLAASEGKTNIVARLLQGKANPNIKSIDGSTPLHDATFFAHVEVIKVLLKGKADPNIIDHTDGMAPLHIACDNERLETVQLLLHMSIADPNILDTINKSTPLHYAAKKANLEILSCIIKSNANPSIQNGDGFTPLHILCSQDTSSSSTGLGEMVDTLVKANADPNIQSSHELLTPLHYASIAGSFEIVSSLLKAKANPNIQDRDGSTPLVLLLMPGTHIKSSDDIEGLEVPVNQYEIVDALLQGQADPNIANKFGCTPIFLAAFGGKTDIVSRLLRGNANPNIQTNEGMMTPLYGATCNGHVEVIKVLLEEKADPNIFDSPDRMAPLHIACGLDGSLEIARVILSCPNTNPNILDVKHATPLHYAVSSAQPKILQCLIASNANPNIRNDLGLTPLHIACNQAGILPKTEVNADATALEMAGILLKAKADPHMDSIFGTTFQIAIRKQNAQLLLILFLHRNN